MSHLEFSTTWNGASSVALEQLYQERSAAARRWRIARGFFATTSPSIMRRPLGMGPSPNIFLSAVATRTRRIHMGPLVYLLPLYHPMRLVEEICMLDQLSGGRLEVGVGRGISPYELAHFGVSFLESREIFEESLKVIVKGLRTRKISHRGERYKFAGAPIEVASQQQPNPPFWYAASTPDGLAFAARHRMQIVTGGPNAIVKGTAAAYRQLLDQFRDSPDDLNPQIKEPKIGAVRHFLVADTDRQAEEIAIPAYRVYYRNITKLWRDFGLRCRRRCLPTTCCARVAPMPLLSVRRRRRGIKSRPTSRRVGLTIWYYRSRGAV